jgi:MFS family permease
MRALEKLCFGTLLMSASSAAMAHGDMFAVIAIAVAGSFLLGAIGGALSGWLGWRLAFSLAGAFALSVAILGVWEWIVETRFLRLPLEQRYKNFWPNLLFFSGIALIPVLIGCSISHATARWLAGRGAKSEVGQ